MGILDVFNKQKRTVIFSKVENDQCRNDRSKLLQSFRTNAKQFLTFKYPRSVALINNYCPLFVLYDKHTGKVHQGEFADYYAPFLQFVAAQSNLLELHTAINAYKEQMTSWRNGLLIQDHPHRNLYNEQWASDFNKNGFYLKDTYRYDTPIKKDDFYGFSLFLNGERIAFSSCWEQKPAGHFAESIFKNVIDAKHTSSTGFSTLTLVAGCYVLASEEVVGCVVPGRIQYEIIFGNGERFLDTNYKSDAKQSIIALRDFLSELENGVEWNEDGDKLECHAMLNDHTRKAKYPGIEDMYPQ